VIMGAAVLGSAVAVRGVQKYDAKKASSATDAGGAKTSGNRKYNVSKGPRIKDAKIKGAGGANTLGKDIVFGSSAKSTQKLTNQMANRGWTETLVRDTVDSSYTTRASVNKATGNSATVYYTERGSYVIVDDVTKEIVQVSDNINPSTWAPDTSIVNPYIPE